MDPATALPCDPADLKAGATPTLLDLAPAEWGRHPLLAEEPPFRARQVREWVFGAGVTDPLRMTNLPEGLRRRLADDGAVTPLAIEREHLSADGARKFLFRTRDEHGVETVLIPAGDRRTLCVSSQVGCAMGCLFCASGLAGFTRNLTAGEMVAQVVMANGAASPAGRVNRVVMMGMGEPLLNYANLLSAMRLFTAEEGCGLGARRITVSTVGIPARIRDLADAGLGVHLALSLHAPTAALREKIIPPARRVPLDELMEAIRYYFEKSGREVLIEYILLAGVNDSEDEAQALARLVKRYRATVNLIPANPVVGLPYRPPAGDAIARFQREVRRRGIRCTVRRRRGDDVSAACGQLAGG
ncbi:MAG: 23S rRNA (adenine(2503)-C(2))-methyltransferase RlmN [Planctomycetes bacterium]|nr:23S rRNA (adenine(2503)-C(2))-methyltransferase RlmN [Planctomycetota bacterium]